MRCRALAGCVLGGAILLASAAEAEEPPYWGDLGSLIGFGMACDAIRHRQEMYRSCFGKAARAIGWNVDDAYIGKFLGQMQLMSVEDRYDNHQEICGSVDRLKDQIVAFDRHVERCGN